MTYTVVWEPPAERDLAALWLRSRMKYAMTEAVARIDTILKYAPNQIGEPREHGRRALFSWPLGVSYAINEDDRLVRILSVWKTGGDGRSLSLLECSVAQPRRQLIELALQIREQHLR